MKNKNTTTRIHALFHNIRSAHNVGSMIRTADAIGVSQIYLSGYTPSPLDRFGRPVKAIAKTALGAELSIPWEYRKDPRELILLLKSQGFTIVGIEQDARAIDYKQYQRNATNVPVLVIVGNEVLGMSKSLREKCDILVEIPMYSKKESLNVSVAFGIMLFRIFDR